MGNEISYHQEEAKYWSQPHNRYDKHGSSMYADEKREFHLRQVKRLKKRAAKRAKKDNAKRQDYKMRKSIEKDLDREWRKNRKSIQKTHREKERIQGEIADLWNPCFDTMEATFDAENKIDHLDYIRQDIRDITKQFDHSEETWQTISVHELLEIQDRVKTAVPIFNQESKKAMKTKQLYFVRLKLESVVKEHGWLRRHCDQYEKLERIMDEYLDDPMGATLADASSMLQQYQDLRADIAKWIEMEQNHTKWKEHQQDAPADTDYDPENVSEPYVPKPHVPEKNNDPENSSTNKTKNSNRNNRQSSKGSKDGSEDEDEEIECTLDLETGNVAVGIDPSKTTGDETTTREEDDHLSSSSSASRTNHKNSKSTSGSGDGNYKSGSTGGNSTISQSAGSGGGTTGTTSSNRAAGVSFPWTFMQCCNILDTLVLNPNPIVNLAKALGLGIWFWFLVTAPTVNSKDNYVGGGCTDTVTDFYDNVQGRMVWNILAIYGMSLGARLVAIVNGRRLKGDLTDVVLIGTELVLALITIGRGELEHGNWDDDIGTFNACEIAYSRLAYAYYSIALGLSDTLLTLMMASLSACLDPNEKDAFADSRDGQSWFVTSRPSFKWMFGLALGILEVFIFVRIVQTFRNDFIPPIFVTGIFLLLSCCLISIPLHPTHYGNDGMGLSPVWKMFFMPGVGLAILWIDLRNAQSMPAILVGVTIAKAAIDFALELLPIDVP